jgi:hypothetical protein
MRAQLGYEITGLGNGSCSGGCRYEDVPEQEATYALDFGVSRDDLKPDVQVEYDRQLEVRRCEGQDTGPDAIFPALGVQVRGDAVEPYAAPVGAGALGPLTGAEARLTDGSQAWSPGRAMSFQWL